MHLKEKHLFTSLLLFFFFTATAQTKKDHVNTLVAAENYFAANAREKGIRTAFLNALADDAILFRNGSVTPARAFYDKMPETKARLFWEPVYARVAKSGDWGFTTGPFTYRQSDSSSATSYGDYFSVWRKNKGGVWKLMIDIGVNHEKPATNPDLEYVNPTGEKYMRQPGVARTAQRQDIIISSDKLYATILKADNRIAHDEFVNANCRLLFPGMLPVIGKEQIMAFWDKRKLKVTSSPIAGDRAESGDLAFTYGDATITEATKTKNYNYLRIWEIQPGYKWNVIAEIFVEAGR